MNNREWNILAELIDGTRGKEKKKPQEDVKTPMEIWVDMVATQMELCENMINSYFVKK